MNKKYYVTLTGGKNNAGDFLIKYRAFDLFKEFRNDRDIIDFNEWEPIGNERLEVINKSEALLLLGGPGILPNMYPNIYKLRDNLDDIKVPIIMMGLGWKDPQGNWENTYKIKFDLKTKLLLDRIQKDGYLSSVRDYHTLNTLQHNGYKKILMTGCPAYYDLNYLNKPFSGSKEIQHVAFSLGVSFLQSQSMEEQMKNIILELSKKYSDIEFEVVFHHSLDKEKIQKVYGNSHDFHIDGHLTFVKWLDEKSIKYVDISGSAENLMNYYENVDLHIGYRVHAHIFMNSISKFSILLNEDGRGKGVKGTIGGIAIDAYDGYKSNIVFKVLNRLMKSYDRYIVNRYTQNELLDSIEYEDTINFNRLKTSRKIIDSNFEIMRKFIKQLP